MSKLTQLGVVAMAGMAILGVGRARAERPDSTEPQQQIRIHVAATRGEIIPQSKGGGGFQRTFRFTAIPGKGNHWIRQVLEVRGTVFDAKGRSTRAHLDVIEYYRVSSSGRTIQGDSHYSQYWDHCGGSLTISSTLTYGMLRPKKRGDTILAKSFILRSAKDAAGRLVTMKTRTTRQVIPAEHGKRAEFQLDVGSIPTHYTYKVRWDVRPGRGSRTRPSGALSVGTWMMEPPKQTGPTVALVRPRPIPTLKKRW